MCFFIKSLIPDKFLAQLLLTQLTTTTANMIFSWVIFSNYEKAFVARS